MDAGLKYAMRELGVCRSGAGAGKISQIPEGAGRAGPMHFRALQVYRTGIRPAARLMCRAHLSNALRARWNAFLKSHAI